MIMESVATQVDVIISAMSGRFYAGRAPAESAYGVVCACAVDLRQRRGTGSP